jgi:hypothetical protein
VLLLVVGQAAVLLYRRLRNPVPLSA